MERGWVPPRVSTPTAVSLKGARHGPAALATASCPETAATHPQRNPWLCRRRCSPAHSTADATRSARGKSRASSSCRRVQKCGEGERACARRIKRRLPSLVSRTLGILGAVAPAACSPPRLTAEALREKPFLEAASMAPRTRWWWEGGEGRALEPQASCGTHILFPPRTSWLRKVTRSQRAAGPFPATHRAPAQSLDQPGPPSYCSPFLKPPGSCRCRQES